MTPLLRDHAGAADSGGERAAPPSSARASRGIHRATIWIAVAALTAVAVGGCCRPTTGSLAAAPAAEALCVGGPIRAAGVDARWTRLAVADGRDTLAVWDLRRRRLLSRFAMGGVGSLNTGARHVFAFSADGTLLANAGTDGRVRVWRAADGRQLAVLPHSPDSVTRTLPSGYTTHFGGAFPVHAVWFDPRGRWLASASSNGSVIVWSIPGWSPRDTLWTTDTTRHTGGWLWDAVLTDSGRTLVTATYDGTVQFWETGRWRSLGRLEHVVPALAALAASPDGARLAAAGQLGDVRVWSRATDVLAPAERFPNSWTPRLAFFPRGDVFLVSARSGGGGVLHGREVSAAGVARLGYMPLLPNHDALELLEVSPDGHRVLTGRLGDVYVYEWRIPEQLSAWGVPRGRRQPPWNCRPGTTAAVE